MGCAGPIETEIWTRGLATAEGNVKGGGSVWDAPLQRAAAAAVKLTSRPSFYLPASAVGEKVWKVGQAPPPAERARYLVFQQPINPTRCHARAAFMLQSRIEQEPCTCLPAFVQQYVVSLVASCRC